MKLVTRFAPSPTGDLHVGNLRTAIFNFISAKKSGGEFILRLDDTDKERSTQKYADQIKRDLEWLGLEWDRYEKQSDRLDFYKEVLKKLRDSGDVYECFETAEELELKRKKQLNVGKPPVYDRSALKLTKSQLNKLRNERPSHWRFKLDRSRTDWTDRILGLISVDTKSVSDPVVVRGDGQFLYTLASVVDDIDFDINYIIRGSDHVTNTAVQIQILQKLGSVAPIFCHHSLLVGAKGEPLSKRFEALSLKKLKEQGFEPKAIFSFMAQLGTSRLFDFEATIDSVKRNFDISSFGGAPTKFDLESLFLVSKKCLARLELKDISSYLTGLEIPVDIQSDFWDMAKENISTRSDLEFFWKLCRDGAVPDILEEDRDFLAICKKLMPPYPRNQKSWAEWTLAIKSKTSRSGKSLFLPLRKALTGEKKGPDMHKLFPLLQRINF